MKISRQSHKTKPTCAWFSSCITFLFSLPVSHAHINSASLCPLWKNFCRITWTSNNADFALGMLQFSISQNTPTGMTPSSTVLAMYLTGAVESWCQLLFHKRQIYSSFLFVVTLASYWKCIMDSWQLIHPLICYSSNGINYLYHVVFNK